MRRIACVCLAALFGVAAFSWPAAAGQVYPSSKVCDTTDLMQAIPAETGGAIVGSGPAGDRGLSLGQFILSPNGDWAFFLRMPDGYSCVLASGHDWTANREPIPLQLAPTAEPGDPS